MKTAKEARLVSALGFMGVFLPASATMPAGAPPPEAALASAKASASAPREPPPEPLETQSIPTTPSERPTLEEWKTATLIEITRRSRDGHQCRAYRVREWLKVKCDMHLAEIRQFGGSPEDVFLWAAPRVEYGWTHKNGGELILRMRPGDRRIVQFFELIPNMCVGFASSPSVILDEAWIEGDKLPTLILH